MSKSSTGRSVRARSIIEGKTGSSNALYSGPRDHTGVRTRQGLPRRMRLMGPLVNELLPSGLATVSGMAKSGFTVSVKWRKLRFGNDPGRVHSCGNSNKKLLVKTERWLSRLLEARIAALLMGEIGPPGSSCPLMKPRSVAVANH